MNLAELEEKVLEIVQDASFEGNVLPFLNRGILWLAGRYQLTSLDATDTVAALSSANSVALPSNYMHGLYFVGDGVQQIGKPEYYYNFARFQRRYPDLTKVGQLHDVAVRGSSLYYTARETKTLTVQFFESPTLLSKMSDVPDFLPAHLQEPLLVNFAAKEIFNLIEDGVEDPKTNTKIYTGMFESYLPDLEMFTAVTDGPEYVQDDADRIF